MRHDLLQVSSTDVAVGEPRVTRGAYWSYLAVIVVAAICVYANTLWNGFAYDDEWIIVANPRVHQLRDLGLIWGTPYWPNLGSVLGLYRPLAIFVYAVEWFAGNGQPWLFHAVNVGLHALVTALVFALLERLTSVRAAFVGALIFALHPVHTEAVANVVGQAELLAAAAMVGACVIWTRRPVDSASVKPGTILAVTVLYVLGLLSKEASVVLPGLLVLLDVAQGRVQITRAGLAAYVRAIWLTMFILAAAVVYYLSVRVGVLGSISGTDAGPGLPFLREEHRLLTAFRAWPEFVRLMFFPMDLSADYSPAVILPVESLSPMAMTGAVLLLATIALACLTPVRPMAGFPAAWFLITILTVSNLLFPVGVVVAERTLYTPSIAVSAMVAFLAHTYWPEFDAQKKRIAALGLVLICGLLAVRTTTRNPSWKNTYTVLGTLVKEHPESYRAAWFAAHRYMQQGDMERSAYYWEAAYLLWNRDAQLMNEFAHFSLTRNDWARAVELLERSREMHPWVQRTHEYLSFAYLQTGRHLDAIAAANEYVRLGGSARRLLPIKANAYEQLGRHNLALAAWRVALEEERSPSWLYRASYARALARNGLNAQAMEILDTLRTTVSDTAALGAITGLGSVIQQQCLRAEPAMRCTDPLADWITVFPPLIKAKQNANSQNATASTP